MKAVQRVRATARSRVAGLPDRLRPWRPRHLARCTHWYVRDRVGRRAYATLNEDDLRASRRSGTVFIFGSGKSLLEISTEEWERMSDHDTVGFSQFQEQQFIRVDYHLVAEAVNLGRYAALFRENPRYESTIYAVQEGLFAHVGNEIVGRGMLPRGSRVFRFHRRARGRFEDPSASFRRGVVHGYNSSISTTNFALLSGWTRIVLVGVDLYDKEYFYLPWGAPAEGERWGRKASDRFPSADLVVECFRRWRSVADASGVSIEVYNPRSLLAEALDIFSWDTAVARS